MNNIFFPVEEFQEVKMIAEHEEQIRNWLGQVENNIENGDIATSICLQAVLCELVIYGRLKTDWVGVLKEYLVDEFNIPIAYSEIFGQRLYKFDTQWKQTPIHAIYTHWFIQLISGNTPDPAFGELVKSFVQKNGWIYNPSVSDTGVKTRMKAELFMSFAMGVEMLKHYGLLNDLKDRFESTLSTASITGYVSSEYFRIRSLETLKSTKLIPVGIEGVIKQCEIGNGYSDFSANLKIDEYMGTAKRTQRDKAVHSPLLSLFVKHISRYCSKSVQEEVSNRLKSFGEHLLKEPFDIPAFQMRDIEFDFGTGVSPLEILCSSELIIATQRV